jgi:hypothetical protein
MRELGTYLAIGLIGLFWLGTLIVSPAEGETYTTFEMRLASERDEANGETDFHSAGGPDFLSTDERVAFLNAYADYASAYFGASGLDRQAVDQEMVDGFLSGWKPQPVPEIRKTLLLDQWKAVGIRPGERDVRIQRLREWAAAEGTALENGVLSLRNGRLTLVEAEATWRLHLSWRARVMPGADATWRVLDKDRRCLVEIKVGADGRLVYTNGETSGNCRVGDPGAWHAFRLKIDLQENRYLVEVDGVRVTPFVRLGHSGAVARFELESEGLVRVDDLAGVRFVRGSVSQDGFAYRPESVVRESFEVVPPLDGWTGVRYDDSDWEDVTLPYAHGGFSQVGEDLYLRCQMELPEGPPRALLELEGIDPGGVLFVNGKKGADIRDRYPAWIDISHLVRPGRNQLAIRIPARVVPNLMHHASADPHIGWSTYRVRLHRTAAARIRRAQAHTGRLRPGEAVQQHTIVVENVGEEAFEGALALSYLPWYPSEGPECASRVSKTFRVASGETATTHVSVTIRQPALWQALDPHLYRVRVVLRDAAGLPVDDRVITTGIRTVAQKGGHFLLNGQPAMLNGAQIMGHRVPADIMARYVRCAPARMTVRELLMVREMGGNMLRIHAHATSDTPDGTADPRLAEMADQLGMMLICCPPGWIREGDERHIDYDGMRHFIRLLYNHPSIVMWELSNHPDKFKEGPGKFKEDGTAERTHEFVRRCRDAVVPYDQSRLFSPTTFWGHTHYGLFTEDADPAYHHRLATRGTQDAITGYGKTWDDLRVWPPDDLRKFLKQGDKAWFNFEHEESTAQPNHGLSVGEPWHGLRSYERGYDKGSIGRVLTLAEWRASQGWQAFSAYESMRKQIFHFVDGFSWCTIEGGCQSGNVRETAGRSARVCQAGLVYPPTRLPARTGRQ